MMLIEIGFRPNNLFIPNSSKYFPPYRPPYAHISQDGQSRSTYFNCKKKKLVTTSPTMPCPEEGTREGKSSLLKCFETIENDLEWLGGRHRSLKSFKVVRTRREGDKGKAASADSHVGNSNRLAVEFPMALSLGSVYSSHVVVYLDP